MDSVAANVSPTATVNEFERCLIQDEEVLRLAEETDNPPSPGDEPRSLQTYPTQDLVMNSNRLG